MRASFLSLLLALAIATPALAAEKCSAPRDNCAQTCEPRIEQCGGWETACVNICHVPRCAPPHKCPTTYNLCERMLCFCPPAHQCPEYACLPCRTVCLPEPCHKPAVLLELVEQCDNCGECSSCE